MKKISFPLKEVVNIMVTTPFTFDLPDLKIGNLDFSRGFDLDNANTPVQLSSVDIFLGKSFI